MKFNVFPLRIQNENIVSKGEIARNEQFHLLLQCCQKGLLSIQDARSGLLTGMCES